MRVRCNIDTAGFGSKPGKDAVRLIQNRIAGSRADVTPEELAAAIQRGRSWKPAEMAGRDKSGWKSQQIIAVDVDNGDKGSGQASDLVTPEEARRVYAAAGLDPSFMHYSFSHTPEWPKFRIIFFLDQAITDRDKAEELARRVIDVLGRAHPGSVDQKCFNGDRLFFGGKAGSVMYSPWTITALADLEALPPSQAAADATPAPAAPSAPVTLQGQGRPLSVDDAKKEVKERWREILPKYAAPAKGKANGEPSFICPFCGHGKGGDGLTYNPASKPGVYGLKCFGCGWSGDIINLVGQNKGASFMESLKICCEDIGIVLAKSRQQDNGVFGWDDEIEAASRKATESPQQPERVEKSQEETQKAAQATTAPEKATPDYKAYLDRCRQELQGDGGAWAREWNEVGRGISAETLLSCGAGFDPAGDPANAPGAMTDAGKRYPAPYMIFPTSSGGYSARRMDGREECEKIKAGPAGFFPADALQRERPGGCIVITEGPHDALSIYEAGYCALALCSANSPKPLLEALEREPLADKPTFVLALDNDAAGKGATETLKTGLQRLGYFYIAANISGKYKDPNAALQGDRDAFAAAVAQAATTPRERPNNTLWYLENVMSRDMAEFRDPIPTGFRDLDKKLGGGLYNGLYVIGAVPGLGKTTLVLQMADQIAAAGHDVLIFSLEMSTFELVSKSLARIVAEKRGPAFGPSALEIRRGKWKEADAREAGEAYKARIGERESVIESIFSCDMALVKSEIDGYMQRTGERPVIILDYLQALRQVPKGKFEPRLPIREFIDDQVQKIEKIAKTYNLPFLVVSSVNRQNYSQLFDYESLKESGGIEFTADVVLGLQLEILHDKEFEGKDNAKKRREMIDAAKAAKPRKVEVTCLKNRYGEPNWIQSFDYYSRCDLFAERETDDSQPAAKPAAKKRGRR